MILSRGAISGIAKGYRPLEKWGDKAPWYLFPTMYLDSRSPYHRFFGFIQNLVREILLPGYLGIPKINHSGPPPHDNFDTK